MHFYQEIKKHTFTMSKYSVLFGNFILSSLNKIVNKNYKRGYKKQPLSSVLLSKTGRRVAVPYKFTLPILSQFTYEKAVPRN